MSVDAELEAWRREWQSEAPVLPDLAATVQRQSWRMRLMLYADVLVTVVIGGGVTAWAARSPQPDMIVLAAAVWIFVGCAWLFARTNRKDCWAPAALTTAAFLDLSIRRCRASVAAAAFGTVLYFVELVFCLGWVYHHKAQRAPFSISEFLSSGTLVVIYVCTLAFVALVIRYRRMKRSELAGFLTLQHGESAGSVVREAIKSSLAADRPTASWFSHLRFGRRKGYRKTRTL
jgi:hypothetical protein